MLRILKKKLYNNFLRFSLIGLINLILSLIIFSIVYKIFDNYTLALIFVFVQAFFLKKKLYTKFLLISNVITNMKFLIYYIFLFLINNFTLKYFDETYQADLIYVQLFYIFFMTCLNFLIFSLVFKVKI